MASQIIINYPMQLQMYDINKLPPAIMLGHQGESLVRTIGVECADWLETYPGGAMAATILLPGYGSVAPLPVDMYGTVMHIPVTRGMTAKAGRGSINLRLLDGEVEKRSDVVPIYIQASHPPVSGEMPDPVQDWVAAANAKLAEVKDGEPGPQGEQGPQGVQGEPGPRGEKGETGNPGPQGSQGLQGIQGEKGDKGDTGPQGPEGAQGVQGIQGPAGSQGVKGDTGPGGLQGIQGPAGIKGDKGDTGDVGPKGDTGAQGPIGLAGADGPQGEKGDPGPQGIQGETGNGIASVTLTDGDHSPGTTDTYTITYTDGNTTTFSVYNGDDGALTASQLSIVDEGEYFTTHNVEAALQEVGAQFVASELPVATYTYNGNAEIVVSAVDVDTDTFTSVGHGLLDTNRIFPTLNLSAIGKYPLQVYAGGMEQRIYYVVNKTDDTFQISLTSGGAAVNLTTNATLDLASWHFEKGVAEGVVISGLPARKKYKCAASGKFSSSGARYFAPFSPTSWSDTSGFFGGVLRGYSYPWSAVTGYGGVGVFAMMEFDTNIGVLSVEYQCIDIDTEDASKLTSTYAKDIYAIPIGLRGTSITAVRFKQHSQFVANGTILEVYSA